MRRREFITLIGGAAASSVSWPLAARAQQADRPRRIGLLMGLGEHDPEAQLRVTALRAELAKLGWIAGRNVQLDVRWAIADGRVRDFAKDLVRLQPDVILAQGTPSVAALVQETRSIPIVFLQLSDPVGSGFVQSLAKPGGHLTGFTNFETETISEKWLELLKQMAPAIRRGAILFSPDATNYPLWQSAIERAAALSAVESTATPVRTAREAYQALTAFARERNGALVVLPDTFTVANRATIVALATEQRLPAVYPFKHFVQNGGLMSYGVDGADLYRRAAAYADRILKGADPGELPVQAPKYELVVNLKAAKALGLDVPPPLLASADEVIK
jgi:putative tryptophan/tyrosine transport system substrate-binding protein